MLVALFVSFFVMWGCDDDAPTPVKTTPTDTTDVNDTTETVSATVMVGFTEYEVVTDQSLSSANYVAGNDETDIYMVGNANNSSNTPIEILLTVPGNMTGTFKQAEGDAVDITVDVEAAGSVKYKQYDQDTDSKSEITITEYGDVGGEIKGTFKGRLKANLTGEEISGTFTVKRGADQ